MRKALAAIFVLALAASAANVKLYLKEGGYQLVREYTVQSDRVRFYSLERGEWEEIPLEMVDLKRTESEAAERQAEIEKDAKVIGEEEKAERDLKREIRRIPQDPGVYWLEGTQVKVIKAATTSVRTKKGRSILKALSPIPIIPGKGTLEIDNPASANVFANAEQDFYIQLSQPQRFGVIKLTPKDKVRIVENLNFMPVSNEVVEELAPLDMLQQQLTPDGLYKIWPKQPLPPGEYAVVEYTDGKMNVQVWDFAIKPTK